MFASVAIAALLAAAQAAPDAAPAAKPAAEASADAKAKPKMRRVCYKSTGSGSRLERKTCVMEKVDEEDAEAPADKAKPGA
jgi:hypothetical protein